MLWVQMPTSMPVYIWPWLRIKIAMNCENQALVDIL